MNIRRLRISNVEETSKLLRETIKHLKQHYTAKEIEREIDAYSAKNVRACIKRKDYIFRVAEDKGKIVGVIVCTFPGPSGLCWINWIMVRRGYRRSGIGGMLIKNLEKTANGRWNRIQCKTRMNNKSSSRMFKELGYRKKATLRRRIHKRNVYAWEKILKDYT